MDLFQVDMDGLDRLVDSDLLKEQRAVDANGDFLGAGAPTATAPAINPNLAGCTDPLASNYNPRAAIDQGCKYSVTFGAAGGSFKFGTSFGLTLPAGAVSGATTLNVAFLDPTEAAQAASAVPASSTTAASVISLTHIVFNVDITVNQQLTAPCDDVPATTFISLSSDGTTWETFPSTIDYNTCTITSTQIPHFSYLTSLASSSSSSAANHAAIIGGVVGGVGGAIVIGGIAYLIIRKRKLAKIDYEESMAYPPQNAKAAGSS